MTTMIPRVVVVAAGLLPCMSRKRIFSTPCMKEAGLLPSASFTSRAVDSSVTAHR